jgi:hypothetical protein
MVLTVGKTAAFNNPGESAAAKAAIHNSHRSQSKKRLGINTTRSSKRNKF